MTSGSPLLFPGSRALADWWHALSSWHPRALWVGHLFLHHVEALVRFAVARPVEPLPRMVLQALLRTEERTLRGVDQLLHLGPPFLHQTLRSLEREQLAEVNARGEWSPTSAGQQVLHGAPSVHRATSRENFHFLECVTGSEQPARPPEFVSCHRPRCSAFPAGTDWRFDLSLLAQCVRRDPGWKARRDFPASIEEILLFPPSEHPSPARLTCKGAIPARQPWEHVILDLAEHLFAALVLVTDEDGSEKLLGFEARQEGWTVTPALPVITLGDWLEVIPVLRDEPTVDQWRSAWRSACQQWELSVSEAELCSLTRHENHVEIMAPRGLAGRLQSPPGELWLLAGSGPIRRAAPVVVGEQD